MTNDDTGRYIGVTFDPDWKPTSASRDRLDEMLRRIDDVTAEPTPSELLLAPNLGASEEESGGSEGGDAPSDAELERLGTHLDERDFAEALGLVPVTAAPVAGPSSESILDAITAAYARLGALPPMPGVVKLTQAQFDSIPKAPPPGPFAFGGQVGSMFGVPIEIVPAASGAGVPTFDELPGVDLTPRPWRRLLAKHQHIWTTTSPMRCVECRRYLRPWWRRVRDRIRRRSR